VQRRQSGEGIVYSTIGVKKWAENLPSSAQVRPGCCSRCGAASQPLGAAVVLHGHGIRWRQVRGPASAEGGPETVVVAVRRYRCQRCGAITTVLPGGLCARRHYSASAIGLALCLFGLVGLSMGETRERVCTWRVGFELSRWTTLRNWVDAVGAGQLLPRIVAWRPWLAGGSLRHGAERAAACLCALAPAGSGSPVEQAFAGAALAA
jgi:Domain of unknown function (DUF6431)